MRLPLAANLESRDGTTSRDALVTNALVEVRGDRAILRMRPRLVGMYFGAGAPSSQMLASWYGFHAIYGDQVNSYPTFGSATGLVTNSLTTDATSERMSYAVTGSGVATPLMMFKNSTNAWTLDKGYAVSAVTYGATMGAESYELVSLTRSSTTVTATVQGNTVLRVGQNVTIAGAVETQYNGTWAVTSVTAAVLSPERTVPITITRSGTTATATSATPHGLTTATAYTISGANQSGYNGSKTITVTSPTTFTFTVTVTAMASPATGSPALSDLSKTASISNFSSTTGSSDKTYFVCDLGFGNLSGIAVGSTFTTGMFQLTGSYTVAAILSSNSFAFYVLGTTTNFSASTSIAVDLAAVSSITYTATTATVTTSGSHNLLSGTSVTVSGAAQSGYNATATITVTGATTFTYPITPVDTPETPATGTIIVTVPQSVGTSRFTYEIGTTPATPATGTITASVVGGTVPGIVYLDGYFFVMDVNGLIYNSGIDDPSTWNALDFITAQKEDGQGVAVAKSRDYVVALKEWSNELFYNAGNATGSPLGPVDTGFEQVGCANGWSVAEIDGAILWVGQSRAGGRGVWLRDGINSVKVSTPDVDRVLAQDALDTVYAFAFKPRGIAVYVLTLPDSDITLVYDIANKLWGEWSRNDTIAITVNVASITRSGQWATVICATPHFLSDGDPVRVVGADQTEYNSQVVGTGAHVASVIDATTYRFIVSGEPSTPATGTITSITLAGDTHIGYSSYVNHEGIDVVQTADNGNDMAYFSSDEDANILEIAPQFRVRTAQWDGGTTNRKRMGFLRLIASKSTGQAWVRWSDDDGQTWSAWRPLDLADMQPEVRRCGSFRARQFEVKYIGKRPPIMEALEIEPAA